MPWASVNRLRLTPPLPRSVGLGPVFSPAQGRFGHGAVHTQPTQSSPFKAFQSHPPLPQRQPIPGAGGRWTRSCPWRPRLPLAQCAARRRCHWRRCGQGPEAGRRRNDGCSLGDQRCQHLPELVGDLERAGGGIGLGGWASTLRTWRLGVFRFGHCPRRVGTFPPVFRIGSKSASIKFRRISPSLD